MKNIVSNDVKIKAHRIKALCHLLVKISNQEIERKLSHSEIRLNISSLIPLRIVQSGPITIQELSKLIFVAPATLIPVIDELESRGLVSRQIVAGDRRKKMICTTAKGSKLVKRILEMNQDNKLVLSVGKLSKNETDTLILLLEKLMTDVTGSDLICSKISKSVSKLMPKGAN